MIHQVMSPSRATNPACPRRTTQPGSAASPSTKKLAHESTQRTKRNHRSRCSSRTRAWPALEERPLLRRGPEAPGDGGESFISKSGGRRELTRNPRVCRAPSSDSVARREDGVCRVQMTDEQRGYAVRGRCYACAGISGQLSSRVLQRVHPATAGVEPPALQDYFGALGGAAAHTRSPTRVRSTTRTSGFARAPRAHLECGSPRRPSDRLDSRSQGNVHGNAHGNAHGNTSDL